MNRDNIRAKHRDSRSAPKVRAAQADRQSTRRVSDRLITGILVCVLIVGVGLLAYPSFSDYWNSFHQTRAVMSYAEHVSDMNEEEYERILGEARTYNEELADRGINWTLSEEEKAAYEEQLDVGGNGIMGYIKGRHSTDHGTAVSVAPSLGDKSSSDRRRKYSCPRTYHTGTSRSPVSGRDL